MTGWEGDLDFAFELGSESIIPWDTQYMDDVDSCDDFWRCVKRNWFWTGKDTFFLILERYMNEKYVSGTVFFF